jgi:hypothetical protein
MLKIINVLYERFRTAPIYRKCRSKPKNFPFFQLSVWCDFLCPRLDIIYENMMVEQQNNAIYRLIAQKWQRHF